MNPSLADLVGRLESQGRITADDVLAMRRELYGAPSIGTDEIEALIALDAAAAERGPEWGDFFAGAMVDYVVRQQAPEDYVDENKSAWLMAVMAGDARQDSALEALVRIVETAVSAPSDLAAFVLDKVKQALVAAGKVDAGDIALLRRVVFAGGGPGNVGVTRAEADALFDVNKGCKAGPNDAAWPDFFAKAVADSLTAVSPFKVESREDAARDAAWLNQRESPAAFMGSMARTPDVRGAMHDILHPFADEADEWKPAEAGMEGAQAAAASITEEEARWLLDRLGPGGLGQPEQRLIELLKSLSPPSIDRLAEVMDKAA